MKIIKKCEKHHQMQKKIAKAKIWKCEKCEKILENSKISKM